MQCLHQTDLRLALSMQFTRKVLYHKKTAVANDAKIWYDITQTSGTYDGGAA